jgi:diadenosine tetraphosphate (Ap4A) HIT family hydrolase
MPLTCRALRAVRHSYAAEGFNLGVNEGKIAGAGFAGHVHLQVVPRWAAGSNFVARRTRVCCHSRCRTPTRGCASGSPEFRRRIWRGVAPVLHSHHRS